MLESLGVASTLSPLARAPEAPLSPFGGPKYLATATPATPFAQSWVRGGVPAPNWSAYQARCEGARGIQSSGLERHPRGPPLGHPQRETLAGALGAPPLRKPAGHHGDETSDFFPCDLAPGGRETLRETLEQVLEQMGEGAMIGPYRSRCGRFVPAKRSRP